jgi:hypothetical protein
VKRFERGVQLYEAENFDGALVEFNAAYKLSNNFKILYNIGICQNAMKDYVGATETFTKYLAEGGDGLSEARKADVQERLSKLALMVARVKVKTDAPAGTALMIDDQPAGTTPLPESVLVKAGRRQFSITAHGKTATKSLDVSSSDASTSVSLMLADVPSPAPPASPTMEHPGPTPKADDGPSFPWPFWTLTALLGGGAAVTGFLAVEKKNELGEKQAQFGASKSDLESARDDARTFGYITDGLLAGTVIFAGLSTYLTIRYFGKRRASAITVLPMGVGFTRSF